MREQRNVHVRASKLPTFVLVRMAANRQNWPYSGVSAAGRKPPVEEPLKIGQNESRGFPGADAREPEEQIDRPTECQGLERVRRAYRRNAFRLWEGAIDDGGWLGVRLPRWPLVQVPSPSEIAGRPWPDRSMSSLDALLAQPARIHRTR